MEHKLIQGGEQFLPFARSRIKALRATGLKHATQRFSIDGVEIAVRLVGEHEYIDIRGGNALILSGVVKGGEIADGSLYDYKPTLSAWQNPLKKDASKFPLAFRAEEKLPVKIYPPLMPADGSLDDSQYKHICASKYSGLMAKAVQVILGYGQFSEPATGGVQVKYDYRWVKCHGICTDSEGGMWIVEISQADGIRAMRLPLRPGSKTSKQKVISETTKLFGGLPSGAAFVPTHTLASAADLDPIYTKNYFSTALGWSFNDSGSEAHNTCYTESAGVAASYHYKIDITLTDEVKTAVVSLVSSDLLDRSPSLASFGFYEPEYDVGGSPYIFAKLPGTAGAGVATRNAPLLACHINGVLHVVSQRQSPGSTNDVVSSGFDLWLGAPASQTSNTYDHRRARILSTGLECDPNVPTRYSSVVSTQNGLLATYSGWGGPGTTSRTYSILETTTNVLSLIYGDVGLWPKDSRDCYAISVQAGLAGPDGKRSAVTTRTKEQKVYIDSGGVPIFPTGNNQSLTSVAGTYALTYDPTRLHTVATETQRLSYVDPNPPFDTLSVDYPYSSETFGGVDGATVPTSDGTIYQTWTYAETRGTLQAGSIGTPRQPASLAQMVSPVTVRNSTWGEDPQCVFSANPTKTSAVFKFVGSLGVGEATPTNNLWSFLGYVENQI